ncbi:MAG: acetyl-CoA carboxylase carboxyltransferase subunit alpha [Gemmatimonadota bacterium]|uniref:acetyl-CoA carboxylase carboxyltransferase subunit alpha n=1 Tax=Candidatus Palauibacter scopulicola TaxID=3056741 RepID=UPI0023A3522E|nr:acetyl-CoA carboxylase carboxyltransferase subunit alpha [Candidatus Palauibacter scopulicola]MDE2662390.1 acetyl-CoA carboxylase carboxyltransferase subunit alpha [Candidatus Palauibacter scopulicola]
MSIEQEGLAELRNHVEELRNKARERGIDVSAELGPLEAQLAAAHDEAMARLSRFDRVKLARNQDRPFSLDYIQGIGTDFFELRGDRVFRDDPAIVGGWLKLDDRSVMVIGHQKGREMKENLRRNFGSPHPEGYRKAKRLLRLAEKFGRPVITFIDTQGAYPGIGAEERGQAEAIARNLAVMAGLRVPIVSCVIGEGGSGGALGIGVADRVLMMENAIYSVISPEGCAAILWRSREHSDKAAEALKLTARDLQDLGVVDQVIPEPRGGAHADREAAVEAMGAAIRRHLRELAKREPAELVESRRDKYYAIGAWEER